MKFTTDHNIYEVQEIIDRKLIKGKLSYLVKWKGYHIDESTWQPIQNVTSSPLCIATFEKKRERQKKQITRQKKVRDILTKIQNMKRKKKQFNIQNVFPCLKSYKKNQQKIQQATQVVYYIDNDCIELEPNSIIELKQIKNQELLQMYDQ